MSLVHWRNRGHDFDNLDKLQRGLNRLFEEFSLPRWTNDEDWLPSPKVEMTQSDEEVIIKLEVPGIEAKDIDIEVTEDYVSISGERKQENREEKEGMTRSEFHYGKFQRVIPLPVKVDKTNTTADYKDGILNLKLPKAEEEKNKVVKVQIS